MRRMNTTQTRSHGHPRARRNQGRVLKINLYFSFLSMLFRRGHSASVCYSVSVPALPGVWASVAPGQPLATWAYAVSTHGDLPPRPVHFLSHMALQPELNLLFMFLPHQGSWHLTRWQKRGRNKWNHSWDKLGWWHWLSAPYIKKDNKALWVSRCRLFSYFILWPLHIFDISHDLWEIDWN